MLTKLIFSLQIVSLTHVVDDFEDVLELLEALLGGHREDEDECVASGDGEALHGGELLRPRRVRDVHSAYRIVRRNHLRRNQFTRGDFIQNDTDDTYFCL